MSPQLWGSLCVKSSPFLDTVCGCQLVWFCVRVYMFFCVYNCVCERELTRVSECVGVSSVCVWKNVFVSAR